MGDAQGVQPRYIIQAASSAEGPDLEQPVAAKLRLAGGQLPLVARGGRGHLVERLRAAVAQRCGCTLGLGIADLTPHDDFASLVERADRALLRTKRARDVSR